MASLTRSFIAFLLLATTLHFNQNTAQAQNCYYPNGDLSTEGDGACFSDGGFCCPLNWACMSNGLCYLENEGFYGRYTCTDQSWQSGSCSQLCTQGNTASGNEAILQCADGSWCCDGNRSFNCCSTADTQYFSLPQGSQIAFISSVPSPTSGSKTRSTSSSSTTSASSSATSTSNSVTSSSFTTSSSSTGQSSTITEQSTSTDGNGRPMTITIISTAPANPTVTTAATSPTSPPSSHKNIGFIVGLAVGVPVALIALALVCLLLWRNYRKSHDSAASDHASMAKYENPEMATSYGHFPPDGRAPELDSYPVAPTRTKSGRASELIGSSVYSGSPPFSPGNKSNHRVSVLSSDTDGSSPAKGLGLNMVQSPISPEMPSVNEEPVELWGGYVPYRPPGSTVPLPSVGAPTPATAKDSEETKQEK